MSIIYTITCASDVNNPFATDLVEVEAKSPRKAAQIAEDLCIQHPGKQVFVEFFRKSDGQIGALNRNGHDITGTNWNRK